MTAVAGHYSFDLVVVAAGHVAPSMRFLLPPNEQAANGIIAIRLH